MQLKNQLKGREWKVVAAVTTAGALGFSGLALAGPGTNPDNPGSIDLRDQADFSSTSVTSESSSTDFTYPSYMFSHSADSDWSSPFSDTNTPSPDTSSPPSPDTPSPSPDIPSPSPDSPTGSPDSISDSPSSADS